MLLQCVCVSECVWDCVVFLLIINWMLLFHHLWCVFQAFCYTHSHARGHTHCYSAHLAIYQQETSHLSAVIITGITGLTHTNSHPTLP